VNERGELQKGVMSEAAPFARCRWWMPAAKREKNIV
jgi:hypothetical protein